MKWSPYILAVAACAPWMYFALAHAHPEAILTATLSGFAILAAGFLLSWACEVAEMDIPPALALSILALVAVLPEYAVDATFAWKAAEDPQFAHYAVANMTGGNRILLGVGWSFLLLLNYLKWRKKDIALDDDMGADVAILLIASLYSAVPVIRGSLTLFDTAAYLVMYVAYLVATARGADKDDDEELVGPAIVLAEMAPMARRLGVVVLFVFSAWVIFLSAEPFAESLVDTGRKLGVDEFVLVQYVAPLASEAPEFVVTILMVLKGHAANGIRALVSSKVNQWTLLVGTLAVVYSIASGGPAALPMDHRQQVEVALTAAQSVFGTIVIADLNFSAWQGVALFALFTFQVIFPDAHGIIAGLYVVLTVGILVFDIRTRNGVISAFGKSWRMLRGRDFVDRS